MKKNIFKLLSGFVPVALVLAACTPATQVPTATTAPTQAPPTAAPTAAPSFVGKVCEVTDTGGVDDKSFNATAWAGALEAGKTLNWEATYLESKQQTDYEKNINEFLGSDCALIVTVGFLLGLADLRRPLSLRNLDLAVLVSLSVSLWFFNDGRIFTSVPLVYPVLLYLLGRMLWIGLRARPSKVSKPLWPVWLLVAATIFLSGFRIGLDLGDAAVIDVGYSGVIGAQRIANGQAPYGHFPQAAGRSCGPEDRNGRAVLRIQTNGRCEKQNEHGDTYGPVAYEAYLPGYAFFGWKGDNDPLHAAHFTAIAFDLA